jgi:hypothetical protein
VEEYKLLLKQLHTDNEGRIDRKELREAISRRISCFSGLRAHANGNRNGFVDNDSSEVEGLIRFAERELGVRITTDPPVRPGSRDAMSGYRALTYQQSNDSSDDMTYFEGFMGRLFGLLQLCRPCVYSE